MIYVGIAIDKSNHFTLQFLPTARYSLNRSNSQMTMIASICFFLNWHHLTRTASS